jgi:hypothetical protein
MGLVLIPLLIGEFFETDVQESGYVVQYKFIDTLPLLISI